MREIVFEQDEYTEVPEGVKVLVQTAVNKLPDPQRRKYRQVLWEEQATQKEAELLHDGVDGALLSEWLNNNYSQSEKGRLPSVVCNLLIQFQGLRMEYGTTAINVALAKNLNTGDPQKCNLRYLKTILKNDAQQISRQSTTRPDPQTSQRPPSSGGSWDRVRGILERRLSRENYNAWIRPCQCSRFDAQGMDLIVPTETHRYWIREYYTPLLCEAFKAVCGRIPSQMRLHVKEGA